jgi:hypothetical protein
MATIDKVSTWAKLASPPTEDPPQSRKDSGWNGGEQPEAEYWNFLEEEDRDKMNELIDQVNPNTLYRPDLLPSGVDPASTAFIQGLWPALQSGVIYGEDTTFSVGPSVELVDLAYTVESGLKKILTLDRLDDRIYVVDVDTQTVDRNSGTNLAAGLPAPTIGSWQPNRFCTDGTYVYVTFRDFLFSAPASTVYRLQAYNLSDWAVKSGWPSTGVSLTGSGVNDSFGGYGFDNNVIFATSTKLAVVQSWNTIASNLTEAVAIVDASDGSVLTEGAGNLPIGSLSVSMGGIVSDGSYVYYSFRELSPHRGGVAKALITDLTVGGSGSWPNYQDGPFTVCDVVYDGLSVTAAFCDDADTYPSGVISMIRTIQRSNGDTLCTVETPNDGASPSDPDQLPLDAVRIVYDGTNLWVHGLQTWPGTIQGSDERNYIWKTNTINIVADFDTSAVTEPWSQTSPKKFWNGRQTTRFLLGPMVFDGRDIWVIPQALLPQITRIKHAAIR